MAFTNKELEKNKMTFTNKELEKNKMNPLTKIRCYFSRLLATPNGVSIYPDGKVLCIGNAVTNPEIGFPAIELTPEGVSLGNGAITIASPL